MGLASRFDAYLERLTQRQLVLAFVFLPAS